MRFLRSDKKRSLLAAIVVATGAVLSACGPSSDVGSSDQVPSAPAVQAAMATSVITSDGTWVTLPMGRLDQPINTFWQLLYRPNGADSSWTNQVEATATATNGGLVLAASEKGTLDVGIRPSAYLTFTPVISTSDGAKSWSDGLISNSLVAQPDALAVGGAGAALALVNNGDEGEILTTTGPLSRWVPLVDQKSLITKGPCHLRQITAVGYLADDPLVGGSCNAPGQVGLYQRQDGSWQHVELALPNSLSQDGTQILGIERESDTTAVLLAATGQTGTSLLVAWSDSSTPWQISAPVSLKEGESVGSFGATSTGGMFALLDSADTRRLLSIQPLEGSWKELPSPPSNTATVAFNSTGPIEALVNSSTTLTVWALASSSDLWTKKQVMQVPIQFGSSS